jgi:hypothetical protein
VRELLTHLSAVAGRFIKRPDLQSDPPTLQVILNREEAAIIVEIAAAGPARKVQRRCERLLLFQENDASRWGWPCGLS